MTRFDPPGPGMWMRLGDHFPRALTPEYQLIYAATAGPGMADYMGRYGVLARGIDVGYVHGHLFIAPLPLAGPREMRRVPPAAAVWLMSRLHPAFRQRTAAAQRALRERPWRAAAARWFTTERAEWVARIQAVADVEPDSLSGAALGGHLRVCEALVVSGYTRHFELHGDDLLPVGLLIARCAEVGVDARTALATLGGASPLSAGTVEPAAWQLVTGYDLDSLAACELPQRPAPMEPPTGDAPAVPAGIEAHDHDEFTELVADARAAVPLRDDNGAVIGAWPMGLLRRAMLSAGRHLGFDDPALAVEATVDELAARLDGAPSPTNDELRDRRADRARRSELEPPDELGSMLPIPPLDALPRPLALIGAAQLAVSDQMRGTGTAVGIGNRPHVGRALVVDDPAVALCEIEPGDVVVTRATCPAWNAVLAMAGAIVTTHGGLASHAAVLARELKIPAVLGDRGAITRIRTGDLVEVNPMSARVHPAAPHGV
jgi:phosphohistidine swiveling domain-containing protein